MKFLWTSLFIKDLDASVKFYEDVVGLTVENRFQGGPDTEIAFMKSAEAVTKVELICRKGVENRQGDPGITIGFACDHVEKRREELKKAGYEVSEMISPHPGTKFFFVKDPDGISVQFVEE